MLVNNYWLLKKYADTVGFVYANYAQADLGLVNLSGAGFVIAVQTAYSGAITRDAQNFALRNGLTLIIGKGTTPEAITDYALADQVNISLTVNVSTVTSGNGLQTIINASGVNTTGSTLLISEVGIVKTNLETRDQSYANYQSALLARKVLDTPIEVPAGANFTLTYTWDDIIGEAE